MDITRSNKKVILITGSSSGFGKITALTLAREGHRVYASMRDTTGRNKSIFREFTRDMDNLTPLELDVTVDSSVQKAVETIIEVEGKIDVLVNNAGIMNCGVTEAFTVEQASKQFDVNVLGCFRTVKAVLPPMRKQQSGLLIHVSSLAGRAVFPFFGLYCASKHALEAMAESLKYELGNANIDSVIIEPGPFETDLLLRNTPRPNDKATVEAYGEIGAIPDQILSSFLQAVNANKDSKDNDPQRIADAILALVSMDHGQRPTRTLIANPDFGLEAFNDFAQPYQQTVLQACGLG